MLLRSGTIYDPMMSSKLKAFMNFGNPKFRTWWDEYANQVNDYGKTHYLNEKESNWYLKQEFKRLKQRCQKEVQSE